MEAAKQAVVFMDIPEHLVQLVIDARDLDPEMVFNDVQQLYLVAKSVADSPDRQEELRHKLDQHRPELAKAADCPAGQDSLTSSDEGRNTHSDDDASSSEEWDRQYLLTGMSEEGQSATTSAAAMSPSSFSSSIKSSVLNAPTTSAGDCSDPPLPCLLASAMSSESGSTGEETPSTPTSAGNDNDDTKATVETAEENLAEDGTVSSTWRREKLQSRWQVAAAENRRLKHRKFCRACKKVDLGVSGVTFLPCGHFITCEECAEKFDDCPACGKPIMGTVRTFLS